MKTGPLTNLLAAFSFTIAAYAGAAQNLPYDESANAEAVLQAGIAQAKREHKNVLVVFGANWCPDCLALDSALHGKTGTLVNSKFVIVKVDVGRLDKNLSIVERYDHTVKKGIPTAVVLNSEEKVLYATKSGELANARRMSETGIYDFFSTVVKTGN